MESEDPPSVTELAARGTKPDLRHLHGKDPEDFKQSTQVQGNVRRFAEFTAEIDLDAAIRGAFESERKDLLVYAKKAREWLTKLIHNLENWKDSQLGTIPATKKNK